MGWLVGGILAFMGAVTFLAWCCCVVAGRADR